MRFKYWKKDIRYDGAWVVLTLGIHRVVTIGKVTNTNTKQVESHAFRQIGVVKNLPIFKDTLQQVM